MAAWGVGLIIVGALIALAGVGGYIDTRKADRRFKTGYKNNEPDTRNFGRAGRLLLYGVGVCVIGAAINTLSGPKDEAPSVAATSDQSAPVTQSAQTPASDTTESTGDVAAPNPPVAQAPEIDSGVAAAADQPNQSSDATASVQGAQEQSSQNTNFGKSSTLAPQGQTFSTSFNCRRAKADDEIAICSDAGLAAMDRQLGQLYDSAMQTVSDPEALKRSESDWVITRHMCNSDIECLRHAYGERIGQFLGSLGSKPLVATGSHAEQE
jgi:hypothetical protein